MYALLGTAVRAMKDLKVNFLNVMLVFTSDGVGFRVVIRSLDQRSSEN